MLHSRDPRPSGDDPGVEQRQDTTSLVRSFGLYCESSTSLSDNASNMPISQQGMKVLGTPLGHHAFVRSHSENTCDDHQMLLDRIPTVSDLQFVVHGASARPTCIPWVVEPEVAEDFCRNLGGYEQIRFYPLSHLGFFLGHSGRFFFWSEGGEEEEGVFFGGVEEEEGGVWGER